MDLGTHLCLGPQRLGYQKSRSSIRTGRDNMAVLPTIEKINLNLSRLADGRKILYLDINKRLADRTGKLYDGMMHPGDKLHPTLKGYQVWADALRPLFIKLLGPPGREDYAPPPTGNPDTKPPM